jgi:hypothetical protein
LTSAGLDRSEIREIVEAAVRRPLGELRERRLPMQPL